MAEGRKPRCAWPAARGGMRGVELRTFSRSPRSMRSERCSRFATACCMSRRRVSCCRGGQNVQSRQRWQASLGSQAGAATPPHRRLSGRRLLASKSADQRRMCAIHQELGGRPQGERSAWACLLLARRDRLSAPAYRPTAMPHQDFEVLEVGTGVHEVGHEGFASLCARRCGARSALAELAARGKAGVTPAHGEPGTRGTHACQSHSWGSWTAHRRGPARALPWPAAWASRARAARTRSQHDARCVTRADAQANVSELRTRRARRPRPAQQASSMERVAECAGVGSQRRQPATARAAHSMVVVYVLALRTAPLPPIAPALAIQRGADLNALELA